MEASSLHKNRPHLEAVLGPLSAQEDATVRAIFADVDEVLMAIARHFGGRGAGREGTGLELTWYASGQAAIGSHVGACVDGTKCVEFHIELRPSWYFGARSSTLTWEIALVIEADCQHATDHRSMHTVHEASVGAVTALEAAAALPTEVQELFRLARGFSLEHWLHLAADGDAD